LLDNKSVEESLKFYSDTKRYLKQTNKNKQIKKQQINKYKVQKYTKTWLNNEYRGTMKCYITDSDNYPMYRQVRQIAADNTGAYTCHEIIIPPPSSSDPSPTSHVSTWPPIITV